MSNDEQRDSDEGDDTMPGGVDMEDSEEEPELEETEEDRRFIADDEDVDEDEHVNGRARRDSVAEEGGDDDDDENGDAARRRKRKKKRRHDEELDEEDLDLVEENTGMRVKQSKTFKRLKRRGDREDDERSSTAHRSRDVSNIFDDDAEEGVDEGYYDEHGREEDDFIVSDVEPEEEAYRRAHKKEMRSRGGDVYGMGGGLGDEAYQQLYEIFGDGTEYDWALQLKKDDDGYRDEDDARDVYEDAVQRTTSITLADVFEPSEIQERLLTEEDDRIRFTDLPERMQLSGVRSADQLKKDPEERAREEQEAGEAVTWCALAIRAKGDDHDSKEKWEMLEQAVQAVLGFVRNDYQELPFVIRHRRDYWEHIISVDELWHLLEDYEKFKVFTEKRQKLVKRCTELGVQDELLKDHYVRCATSDAMDDGQDYLTFTYAKQLAEQMRRESTRAEFKRSIKMETYDIFRQPSVLAFIDAICMSADQFAESLSKAVQLHSPPADPTQTPLDAVTPISPSYINPEKFLSGVQTYIAQVLFHHPKVREAYGQKYQKDAAISVMPTDAGMRDIDQNHPYYSFKYITGKPVWAFKNSDQFLLMLRAEEEGLVTIRVHLLDSSAAPAEAWQSKPFLASLFEYYCGYNQSSPWYAVRMEIVKQMDSMMGELFAKRVREGLRSSAIELVSLMCEARLFRLARVAPYQSRERREQRDHYNRRSRNRDDFDDEDNNDKIMGLAQVNEGRATFLFGVIVDSDGNLVDQFIDKGTFEDVETAVGQHKPVAIALAGCQNPAIKKTLDELRNRMLGRENIEVVVIDDEVARLYQHSSVAQREHPDLNIRFRYALSIARRLQNPVMEFATLFNQQQDATMLNLYPTQTFVPRDTLYRRLERAMITVVSAAGVDINEAARHAHHSYTLQFVAGLGPRKASGLLQKMARIGTLTSREGLILELGLGPVVFENCASFIRVRAKYFSSRNDFDGYNRLDDTRVHPKDYDLALKMARDALDVDDTDNDLQYITEVMTVASKDLEDLELDDYAKVIADTYGKKRQALEDIKTELQHPYLDSRPAFQPLDPEALFRLLTGETDDTLHRDMIIPAVVLQARERFCRVRLESGVDGIVQMRHGSEHGDLPLNEILRPDQGIKVRVLHVDKEQFQVELALVLDNVQPPPPEERRRDPYFDTSKEDAERVAIEAQKKRRGQAGRVVKHPLFRPFNSQQCAGYLRAHRNEIVIRPSSNEQDILVISWIFAFDVICHIKVKQNPTTGKYTVENEPDEYFDLDEILHKYVERCQQYTERMTSHRKFRIGTPQDAQRKLAEDLRVQHGSQWAYNLCVDDQHPGYFLIQYQKSRNHPHQSAPVRVTPRGYKLGSGTPYQDVELMLNAFKNAASGGRPARP
ncbi:Transcription elongation factor spt6 [Sorochytrium milnesiophthora]